MFTFPTPRLFHYLPLPAVLALCLLTSGRLPAQATFHAPEEAWWLSQQDRSRQAHVRQLEVYVHEYKDNGKLQRRGQLVRQEAYNKNGRLVREVTQQPDGEEEVTWTYDVHGRRQLCVVRDGRGRLKYRTLYEGGFAAKTVRYDDQERVTSFQEYKFNDGRRELTNHDNRGLPTGGVTAYYDPTRRYFYEKHRTGNHPPHLLDYRQLDDQQRVVREATRPADAGQEADVLRATYVYNQAGDRIEARRFGPDGTLLRREVNRYDHRHLLTETLVYDGQEQLRQMETYHYQF